MSNKRTGDAMRPRDIPNIEEMDRRHWMAAVVALALRAGGDVTITAEEAEKAMRCEVITFPTEPGRFLVRERPARATR